MKIYKFKRYKVLHKGKAYYVLIPHGIKDNIWIRDWADWWYGSFVTGNLRAIKRLAACFTLLGFNPYAIIYLPVGNDRIPYGLSGNPENGTYDIVFRSNRIHLKDEDWKAIRGKLKHTKCTTYKLKYNKERVEKYFGKSSDYLSYVPDHKVLKNAGSGTWLAVGTAFFSYPRSYYQRGALDLWCWIKDALEDDRCYNYHGDKDYWVCNMRYFQYGGYDRKKYSHERPGCTLALEMYDIDIANRYLKEKDYMVSNNKSRQVQGITPYTYASESYFKISIS